MHPLSCIWMLWAFPSMFTAQVGRGFSFPANWFLSWPNIDVSLHPSLLAQDGALMGI